MSDSAPKFSAFISYAKADEKKAYKVAECLEERGLKCWIAPRDVRPGYAYGDEIIRGIGTSRTLILVLSAAANESHFVAREVERAVSKKKAVLPIRIAKVEPSPSLELFISGTQWIDAFSGRLAPHIDRLASLIGEREGTEPSPTAEPVKVPRWAWSVAAALAVVVAAGLLWQSNVSHSTRPSVENTVTEDPSVISNPLKLQEPADQVADRPADPEFGPAATGPVWAERPPGPWDIPPAASLPSPTRLPAVPSYIPPPGAQ